MVCQSGAPTADERISSVLICMTRLSAALHKGCQVRIEWICGQGMSSAVSPREASIEVARPLGAPCAGGLSVSLAPVADVHEENHQVLVADLVDDAPLSNAEPGRRLVARHIGPRPRGRGLVGSASPPASRRRNLTRILT